MKQHLNTLFITTQGAYLAKEGQAVLVRVEKQIKLRLPLHTIAGGIVCFGRVGISSGVMAMCAENGVSISLLSPHGRLLGRVLGFTSGNVLLRREQYRRADCPQSCANIGRAIALAKVANARSVLLRALRDYPEGLGNSQINASANRMAQVLEDLRADSAELERVRGLEGEAANAYWSVFDHLITAQKDSFVFRGRTRRPPLDSVNALLSFLYAMLAHDARSAAEAAGLDVQVGFLHRDRPGRPSLALDLMEELRPYLVDRLVLTLINRKQVTPNGFAVPDTGAVTMDESTRKAVLVAYQKRKQEQIVHPFLSETVCVGLLVHLQARLLARHLRGDLSVYPPFIWK